MYINVSYMQQIYFYCTRSNSTMPTAGTFKTLNISTWGVVLLLHVWDKPEIKLVFFVSAFLISRKPHPLQFLTPPKPPPKIICKDQHPRNSSRSSSVTKKPWYLLSLPHAISSNRCSEQELHKKRNFQCIAFDSGSRNKLPENRTRCKYWAQAAVAQAAVAQAPLACERI